MKSIFRKTILTVLFSLIILFAAQAQKPYPICGFDEVYKYNLLNPVYAQKVREAQALISQKQEEIIRARSFLNGANIIMPGGLTEIPVVVHVIHNGGAVGAIDNPSKATIQAMIDHLNETYSATTSANIGASIPLRFKLALRKSDGCTLTDGINRIDGTTITGYSANGVSLPGSGAAGATDASIRNSSYWPVTQYFNIWVVWKINTNGLPPGAYVSGYSGVPYTNTNTMLSGINYQDGIMLNSQDANGTSTTLPHEMGHSMGLFHSFEGDGGNAASCPPNTAGKCATEGDFVCDTDPVKNLLQTWPFPASGDTNPCTGLPFGNIQFNIMGYSPSNIVLNRFTPGQSTRIDATFQALRIGLRTSMGCVAPPASLVKAASPPTGTIPTSGTNSYNAGPCNINLNDLKYQSRGLMYNDGTSYYIDNSCNLGTYLSNNSSSILSVTTQTNIQYCKAWIDFNNDGAFASNEVVLDSRSGTSDYTHTATITPAQMASAATNKMLRMRVAADFDQITSATSQLVAGQAEDFWVNITSPLPVVFGTIEAEILNNTLNINWASLSEQNNSHYEIEASNDGKTFLKIGEVKTKTINGNSAVSVSYNFQKNLNDITNIFGGLIFALLFALIRFKRKNRLLILVFLIISSAVFFQISCIKKDAVSVKMNSASDLFIRIAQVDNNGTKSYSKVIKAIKSDT